MDIPIELKDFLNEQIPLSGPIDIGFELFEFPSAEKLVGFQEGYRWHGSTKERLMDWHENWIVFGASHADPLIFNTRTGEVLFDRHGAGCWNPVVLFPNLDAMNKCFIKISKIVEDADEDLHDEEFNIRSEYVQDIKNAIINSVGSEQGEKIIEAFEIIEY